MSSLPDDRFDLVSSETLRSETIFDETETGFEDIFISGKYQKTSFEYDIPGEGSVYRDLCGSVRSVKRCKTTGLLQVMHHYCYKSSCPICYNAWALRTSDRMSKKIFALSKILPIYHWSVSFPIDTEYSIEEMKSHLQLHFGGAIAFFHPYRLQDEDGYGHRESEKKNTLRWVRGYHWHVLSWTEFILSKQWFEETGVVYRKIKRLDNTFDDIARLSCYELSHVGIDPKNGKAIMFSFGFFANNTAGKQLVKIKIEHNVKCACEVCCKKAYYEERSDCEKSSVKLESYEEKHNVRAYRVCSKGIIVGDYEIYKRKTEYYFPKNQSWDFLLNFCNRLGLKRYMNDIAPIYSSFVKTKSKFLNYNNYIDPYAACLNPLGLPPQK